MLALQGQSVCINHASSHMSVSFAMVTIQSDSAQGMVRQTASKVFATRTTDGRGHIHR